MNKNLVAKELLKIAKLLKSFNLDNKSIVSECQDNVTSAIKVLNTLDKSKLDRAAKNHLSNVTTALYHADESLDNALKVI